MIDPRKVIQDGEHEDAIKQSLRAEIACLRLTDAERALLVRLGSDTREWDKYSSGRPWFVTVKDAAIIRGILERLG
jgi:hypothetical protein